MFFDELYQKITEAHRIIIHRHQNADPDALGSQVGLAKLIQEVFPNTTVKCAGTVPATLTFLAEMDTVFPTDYENALVIITDTANKERIDGEIEWMEKANEWIKIDHHPNEDHYAKLEYVDIKASSTSEIIYDFYKHMKSKLTMTAEIAELLYAGLVGDTGRFLHANTTAKTLQIASELRKYPFDSVELNLAFLEKSKEVTYLSGYVQSHFEMNDAGVAYIIITNDILAKYHVTHDETNSLVSLMAGVKGVESWVLFLEKEGEKDVYRCRIRSKHVPINEIAKLHHGGGHPFASGATAYGQGEIQTIIQELTDNLENNL